MTVRSRQLDRREPHRCASMPTSSGDGLGSDGCTIGCDGPSTPCPTCGQPGAAVGAQPVRSHRPSAVDGAWKFCTDSACRAVYFLGTDTVDDEEVRTQVGSKALARPIPLCFCFSHTLDEIIQDFRAGDGTSAIKASIKTAVADGFCSCAHLNPSGRCCLPAIQTAIRQLAFAEADRPDQGGFEGPRGGFHVDLSAAVQR
jgi:hypothetical protein